MHVVNDVGQRQVVREHRAGRREIFGADILAPPVGAELHDRADVIGRQHEIHTHDRLAKLFDIAQIGHSLRRVNFEFLAAVGRDFVRHVRSGLHEVDVGILLQPLLHDLHVQQAQEAAAEAEAERIARFGLEIEAGVVDRKLVERFAQLLEILAVGRIQAAEDHPLWFFVACQARRPARRRPP